MMVVVKVTLTGQKDLVWALQLEVSGERTENHWVALTVVSMVGLTVVQMVGQKAYLTVDRTDNHWVAVTAGMWVVLVYVMAAWKVS
jgi:hypothetical protein